MKKIAYISGILSVILMFGTVAAYAQSTSLTIEAAQQQALANNKQIAIDDMDIKAKENALKKANDDAAMLGDAFGQERVLSNRLTREVKTMQAAANLEIAKKVKADDIAKLKLDIYTAILDIALAGKELEKENLKLETAKEKVNIAKSQYQAKMITEDDVSAAEYALENKKSDVEAVQDSLKTLDMQLKRLLGMSFDSEVLTIDAKLVLDTFSAVDLDKLIKDRLSSDTAVYGKSEAYKAAQKTMDLTAQIYKEGESVYDDNKVNLENSELDYDEARTNLEIKIRNSYNDLLTLRGKQLLASRFEALMKKKLDKEELNYKKGLSSKIKYLAAKESWMDAVYQNYRTIHDFNIKNYDFMN